MAVQRWVIFTTLLYFFALSSPTFAEGGRGNQMRITYTSPAWNLDSTAVDVATVVIRDKATGKLVTVQLEETEPDSSQFSGQFNVNIGEDGKFQPEIYLPPTELKGKDPDNKTLLSQIQAGKLQRRPIIMKRNERGQTEVAVYDTREQAEAGLKAYQEEQRLAQELRRKKPLKPMTSDAAMAAAKAAERKALMDKMALEAVHHEQDRVRMEQIEREKAKEREERERRMSEEQRAARRAQAKEFGDAALVFYDQGEFKEAEAKFKQAVDLDPENKDYYYKYAITLYRNQKYNDALVVLKVAQVEPSLELEKKYYMGLIYYRLSELDNAVASFSEITRSGDPNMAPLSQFYLGVIYYAQEKYEPAKQSFEKVIDTSKDPKLDQQSEEYLDRISGAMAFQKLRENKWTAMGVVGLMYDSNVLLSPSNNQGSGAPTNSPDYRLLTLGDLQYRPIFNEHHELAPHVTFNLTNSEKTASAPADPWIYDLAVPYSYKGTIGKKSWKMTWTPGYEILYMDPQSTGTKHLEMASYFVTLDNTLVMNSNWFSTFTLQYRHDKSYDPSQVDASDLSGNMFTYRATQTFFVDKARKQALIPMIDYIRDADVGSLKTYNRYDLGVTYVRPAAWETSWNIGLNYYNMDFPGTSAPRRTDSDYALTTGISKPIREWVTWGVTGTYTVNNSTDPQYGYNKYLIMTTATFTTNF